MSWCYSEKIFSIEKLKLIWNKQANFNKICPLFPQKTCEKCLKNVLKPSLLMNAKDKGIEL